MAVEFSIVNMPVPPIEQYWQNVFFSLFFYRNVAITCTSHEPIDSDTLKDASTLSANLTEEQGWMFHRCFVLLISAFLLIGSEKQAPGSELYWEQIFETVCTHIHSYISYTWHVESRAGMHSRVQIFDTWIFSLYDWIHEKIDQSFLIASRGRIQ